MRLLLGSDSARRKDLLAQIGVTADKICPPDIDESILPAEVPRAYVGRIVDAKLAAIKSDKGELLLCADTVVAVGRRILGKAQNEQQARQFLELLSGRRHRVITAVALRLDDKIWKKRVDTAVRFKRLSHEEIKAYLASDEWQGKAGAYAIQGLAAAFIPAINGSYSNVVGLPLTETAGLLRGAGYRWVSTGP